MEGLRALFAAAGMDFQMCITLTAAMVVVCCDGDVTRAMRVVAYTAAAILAPLALLEVYNDPRGAAHRAVVLLYHLFAVLRGMQAPN
ncbi:hypothetical protein EXIGLDRAFT_762158 [Exidia glandulosa HHB12029]|uniref:Uncharacterized protein n=1 Tax=Exidia glandulosa HHB12029 TaxID=1314781 RepID=A0A165IBK7_EXIGL|nr:hypothetical protein EXIGLDRAFT_768292 [Exidia glandulosa HHB12029]KZW00064.1 hypothetical protein EXIGLDRAFT_762158 [Exidia glandulosa HHB12029]